MSGRIPAVLVALLGSLSLLLLAVPGTRAQSSVNAGDRAALKALYTATAGANWRTNTGWDNIDTTTDLETLYGIDVNSSGRVTGIALELNNLTGELPDLSALTSLTYLSFYANNLTGSIPALPASLTTLRLHNNQLTGSIPDLSALTRLFVLLLRNNQLTGSLPALPTSLFSIRLNNNQLDGTIPDLSALTRLSTLELNHNQLTGSLPALPTSLSTLYLHNNQLDGTIPDLSALTSLSQLWLHNNQLTGNLDGLNNLNPSHLFLHNNQLSGAIPTFPNATGTFRLSLYGNPGLYGYPTALNTKDKLRLIAPGDGTAMCLPTTQGDTDCTVPTKVDNLRIQIDNLGFATYPTQLVFTWTPNPADPAPSGYTAQYYPPGGPWTDVPVTGTTATIPNPPPGIYYFLVRTTDSPNTPQLYYDRATLPGHFAPIDLIVTQEGTTLTLTWWAGSGDETGYDVHYKTTTAPDRPASTPDDPTTGWVDAGHADTTTTATITSLTSGTTYEVRVRAKGTHGHSVWTTPPPTDLRVTPGDKKLALAWTAPAGTVIGYDVHYTTSRSVPNRAPAGSTVATGWVDAGHAGTTTTHTIPNLTNDTLYRVRVRAQKGGGDSAWARRHGTPRTPGGPTVGGLASGGPTGGSLTGDGPTGGGSGDGGGSETRTPDDRHGDTFDEATALTPPHDTPGYLRRRLDARLQRPTDVDTFRLDLPHAGILLARTTGGDTTGRLYQAQEDGAPVLIATDTDSGTGRNFRLGVAVEPGTYYLAVSAGTSFGAYRLGVDYTPAFVDTPTPDSPQSGLGVLSGWVCATTRVEIELAPESAAPHTLVPATGTARADTAGVCGADTTATGFGLLFNWNLLGDGPQTVRVLINDVVFAERQITVTTLGDHPDQEYRRHLQAISEIPDFPAVGHTTTLRWEEALQNFVIAAGEQAHGGEQLTPEQARLENPAPGSFQSGLGVISGWVCEADTVEIVFEPEGTDDTLPFEAGSGTERADTADRCGDSDNGFGLLFNWNLLGEGHHTVRAYADGEEFAHSTVTVTTLGEEFAEGLRRTHTIADFPAAGQTTTVEWREGQQNFVITAVE